jgi:hypothetical protein
MANEYMGKAARADAAEDSISLEADPLINATRTPFSAPSLAHD